MVLNGDLWLFHLTLPVILANDADPDQTPRSVASDLGLHRLPMSQMSSPGFTDNPPSTALWRHSDKKSTANMNLIGATYIRASKLSSHTS